MYQDKNWSVFALFTLWQVCTRTASYCRKRKNQKGNGAHHKTLGTMVVCSGAAAPLGIQVLLLQVPAPGHGRERAGISHSHTHTHRNVQLINNRNTNWRSRTEPGPECLTPDLFRGGSWLGPVVDSWGEGNREKRGNLYCNETSSWFGFLFVLAWETKQTTPEGVGTGTFKILITGCGRI